MSIFCPKCDNFFYHQEIDKKLHLVCKNCGYKELTTESLITKTIYKEDHLDTNINKQYLKYDVGYPRIHNKKCPNKSCPTREDTSKQEAIFFPDKTTLIMTYICVECDTEWKLG